MFSKPSGTILITPTVFNYLKQEGVLQADNFSDHGTLGGIPVRTVPIAQLPVDVAMVLTTKAAVSNPRGMGQSDEAQP